MGKPTLDERERKRIRPVEHYPMEKLKHVNKPTTKITDKIERIDEREQGFSRAHFGKLGALVQKEVGRFCQKYPISSAMWEMLPQLKSIADGKAVPNKAPIPQIPEILSRHIKSFGYFLRADIVGICRLPEWAVYSRDMKGEAIELNHKFAVVIVIDQDYRTMSGSTGDDWISCSQSFLSYTTSAFIACTIAAYIRRLGYPARAHFEAGSQSAYQVVVTPLLLLAGIGEICRAGIVLNPFLGTRFKAAVVTTDLPLEPDSPVDFGLQEFCSVCKKCAVECPSRAIPTGDKVMHNGYEVWKFDAERCTKYRITNLNGSACGRCIKVCPWNKPRGWTHDMVRWMVKHTPFMNRLIVKMDDVWGYGRQDIRDKWWFDLEDIDGVLQIPGKS
ncbi:3-chloro-4-hydroxyphenylacetate reductive dehalogenase [subsurface metagenome]